jgi:aminoglycoside 3-N-acetyltransferase
MISFRDITSGLRKLELDPLNQVIAHVSLSSFGEVRGGADTVLGAFLATVKGVISPTFTYNTMLIPEEGPANNGIAYGSGRDKNRMAEFFKPDMPADPLMGVTAETLRRHPSARRSTHPILSFSGIHCDDLIQAQSIEDPLAPVGKLAVSGGWVLLAGVNHTRNTSIHYAEKLAGRKQFSRWALTLQGVHECPGFPGCSDGFEALAPRVAEFTRSVQIGDTLVQAMPLNSLVNSVVEWILLDPYAMLCSRDDCERCDAIRAAVVAPAN